MGPPGIASHSQIQLETAAEQNQRLFDISARRLHFDEQNQTAAEPLLSPSSNCAHRFLHCY